MNDECLKKEKQRKHTRNPVCENLNDTAVISDVIH
jgi:hypothetical protein